MTVSTIPTGPSGEGPASRALAVLNDFAAAASVVHGMISPLVDTAHVPDHHWPQPLGASRKEWPNPRMKHPRESAEDYAARRGIAVASAVGVVLRGANMALEPFAALDVMYAVHGRLGMFVKAKRALAERHGHRIRIVESTPETCTAWGCRKGGGPDDEITFTFTMAEARKAGYTRNEAYEKRPKLMLEYRATDYVLDRIAGDVFLGLAGHDETWDDVVQGEVVGADRPTVTAETIRAARTPRLAAVPPPAVPESEPAPTTETEPAEPGDAEALARQGWDSINAAFRAAGITGPGQQARRLTALTRICGRQITRGSDLTVADTTLVLDTLEGMSRDAVRRLCDPNDVEDAPAVEETPVPAADPATTPARETETVYLPSDEQELDRRWEQGWPTGEAQQ